MPIPLHRDLIELECVNGEKFVVRRDSINHVSAEKRCAYKIREGLFETRPYALIEFADRSALVCWTTGELHKIRHTFRLNRWQRAQGKTAPAAMPSAACLTFPLDLRRHGAPTRPGGHPAVPKNFPEFLVESLRYANRVSGLLVDLEIDLAQLLDSDIADCSSSFGHMEETLRRRFSDGSALHLFIAASNLGLILPDDINGDHPAREDA